MHRQVAYGHVAESLSPSATVDDAQIMNHNRNGVSTEAEREKGREKNYLSMIRIMMTMMMMVKRQQKNVA